MYAEIFVTFTGILSGSVVFLASKLIILFIWSTAAALMVNSVLTGN